jgi:hypothetical protein
VCDVPLRERIKNEMKKGGDCIDVYTRRVCVRLSGIARISGSSQPNKSGASATGWINLLERRGGDQGVSNYAKN